MPSPFKKPSSSPSRPTKAEILAAVRHNLDKFDQRAQEEKRKEEADHR
jgi:hypothetical protein